MARLITEGAESGNVAFWTYVNGVTASATSPFSGAYSYTVGGSSSRGYKSLSPALDSFYYKFRFSTTGLTTIGTSFLQFYGGGSAHLQFCFDPSGFMKAGLGTTVFATGTKPVTTNTVYVLEFYVYIHDTAGRCIVKIDGVTDIDYTGDTKNGSATTVDTIQHNGSSAFTAKFDDICLNDTTGSAPDNTWIGDSRIMRLAPNGNGSLNELTGSDGNSTDNYALVDEVPHNSDTDYVFGSVSGDQDRYALADFDGTDKVILRVQPICVARNTVANGDQIKIGIRTNSTNYLSAAKSLGESYAVVQGDEYLTNPNTAAAWADSDLDGLELVLEIV